MATTKQVNSYIQTIAPLAVKDMAKSKILASITTAQACLESGYGTSELALKANALFGIKDNDAWDGPTYTVVSKEEVDGKLVEKKSVFRKYASWAESFLDHSDYICTRTFDGGKTLHYAKVIGEKDYKKAAQALEDAGYSTYSNYAEMLIDIIERYELYKYDQEVEEMAEIKIYLDAGHGGNDPGAVSAKREEEDDVLKLVLAVGKKLLADYSNVKVGYTRKTDIYESPTKKAQDANNWGADYFFSFHRNSAGATARGCETLVYSNTGIVKELASELNDTMKEVGFKNRGTKVRKELAVLNKTNMPALLLEVGFISNKADNKLFDDKFDLIVEKIVGVIGDVLNLEKKAVKTTSVSAFKNGAYNKNVTITKDKCPVRSARSSASKLLGRLEKGKKVKVLYILKNSAGNYWGSIDYGDDVGYIYMKNVKAI